MYIDNFGRIVRGDPNELYHHGIMGMHWGERNGPPYPIGSNLRNRVPYRVDEIKNYKGKLYFLSETDMNGKTIRPRIPKNYFTDNDFEDNQTPRICFAPSVDQSLMALSQNLKGKTYVVYEPNERPSSVYKPNAGAVPDSSVTGELWVKEPVTLKEVGRIHVTGDDSKDGKKFSYGLDREAELYGWNYEWKNSDKVLNGYSAHDVQRYFDSVPKGDSEYGLKHKDYKETIYRDVPDGKGFIEFYRLPDERHVASIAISVHPNERHKGIASSMIEKGKAHMGELGIDRLEWYCKKSNKASVNLALKNGFKVDKLHSNSEWYTMYYKKDSNNTNPNAVTSRAKALRSSGMTYAEIAKKLGISESSVGHYLNL